MLVPLPCSKTVPWVHGLLTSYCMTPVDPTAVRIGSLRVSFFAIILIIFTNLLWFSSSYICFISDLLIFGTSPLIHQLQRMGWVCQCWSYWSRSYLYKARFIPLLASTHLFIIFFISVM